LRTEIEALNPGTPSSALREEIRDFDRHVLFPRGAISEGHPYLLYFEFLDEVMDYFPEKTTFISGHGRDYTLTDINAYNGILFESISIFRKTIKTGRTVDQMIEGNLLKDYASWGKYLTFLGPDAWIKMVAASYDQEK
jgi:hypothetical protein